MEHLTIPFLGEERAAWQYPFRSLERAGAVTAMGSDWAVSTPNPLLEMEVAVRRVDPADRGHDAVPSRRAHQRAERRERVHDRDRVRQPPGRRDGDDRGGKLADLCVVDRDLFSPEVEFLGDAKVVLTLVDGEPVYTRPRRDRLVGTATGPWRRPLDRYIDGLARAGRRARRRRRGHRPERDGPPVRCTGVRDAFARTPAGRGRPVPDRLGEQGVRVVRHAAPAGAGAPLDRRPGPRSTFRGSRCGRVRADPAVAPDDAHGRHRQRHGLDRRGEYEIRSLRDSVASAPPGELYHYSNAGYKALGPGARGGRGTCPCRRAGARGLRSAAEWSRGGLDQERRPAAAGARPRPLLRRPRVAARAWPGTLARGASPRLRRQHRRDGRDMARYLRMLLNRGRGEAGESSPRTPSR